MRISDWSSDVCSSDLVAVEGIGAPVEVESPPGQEALQPAHEVEQHLVGVGDQQRLARAEIEFRQLGGNRCGKGGRIWCGGHGLGVDCPCQTAWPAWRGMPHNTVYAGKRWRRKTSNLYGEGSLLKK